MPFFEDFEHAADRNDFLAQFPDAMTLTAAIDADLNAQEDLPDAMASKLSHLRMIIVHFSANAALKNLLIFYYADYIFWMNKKQQNPELAYTASALSILPHMELPAGLAIDDGAALSVEERDNHDSLIALQIALLVQGGFYDKALDVLNNSPYPKSEERYKSLNLLPFQLMLESAVFAAASISSEQNIDACRDFFLDKDFPAEADKVDVIIDILFALLRDTKVHNDYTLQGLSRLLLIFRFAGHCVNILADNDELSPSQLRLGEIINLAALSVYSLKVFQNAQEIERQLQEQTTKLSENLVNGSEKEQTASGLVTAMLLFRVNFRFAQAEQDQHNMQPPA